VAGMACALACAPLVDIRPAYTCSSLHGRFLDAAVCTPEAEQASWGSLVSRVGATPLPRSTTAAGPLSTGQTLQATYTARLTAVPTYLDTPLVAYADPRELLLLAAMVDAAAERTEKVGGWESVVNV
jgi:hypothetical protein